MEDVKFEIGAEYTIYTVKTFKEEEKATKHKAKFLGYADLDCMVKKGVFQIFEYVEGEGYKACEVLEVAELRHHTVFNPSHTSDKDLVLYETLKGGVYPFNLNAIVYADRKAEQ